MFCGVLLHKMSNFVQQNQHCVSGEDMRRPNSLVAILFAKIEVIFII